MFLENSVNYHRNRTVTLYIASRSETVHRNVEGNHERQVGLAESESGRKDDLRNIFMSVIMFMVIICSIY